MPSSDQPAAAGGKCAICGRPIDPGYRPFCSRRCADVDLSRWLRGSYAIPDAVESEDGDESRPVPSDDRRDGEGSTGKG